MGVYAVYQIILIRGYGGRRQNPYLRKGAGFSLWQKKTNRNKKGFSEKSIKKQ
jgi:hypothetical protein